MTALVENRKVDVYVYENSSNIDTYHLYTKDAGLLTSINSNEIVLLDGTYDFYCFSVGNEDSNPPQYENSTNTSNLSNGIDYLSNQILGLERSEECREGKECIRLCCSGVPRASRSVYL